MKEVFQSYEHYSQWTTENYETKAEFLAKERECFIKIPVL